MKARIVDKSELRWPELVREYTFDIIEGNEILLSSQSVAARPSEIVGRLEQIVDEYRQAFEESNDLDIGDEI